MIPALRHRAFALLFLATFVSNVGTWMQNVARAWVIYRTTGDDPMWLGWLGLSVAVPLIVLPPFSGRIIDRFDRVRVLAMTQTLGMLVAIVLAWLSLRGQLTPFYLLASSVVSSCATAVDNPTRHALIGDLVPPEDLPSAVSLHAAIFTGAAMIGPAVAGVLLDTSSAFACFALNAASFLGVLVLLPALSRARRPRELATGALVLTPRARTLLLVAAVAAVSVRAHPQLLPVFATRVFHGSARAYGILLAAGGVGALAAALGGSMRREPPRLLWSVLLMILSLALFVSSSQLWLSCVALGVAGAGATMLTTTIATELQRGTPPSARGRVLSLHTVTLIGLPSLGGLFLAWLADRSSERIALIVALLVMATVALVVPLSFDPNATEAARE